MTIHRTVSYMIASDSEDPNDVCDRLLAAATARGIRVEQSGVDSAKGFIRVRAESAALIRHFAAQICDEAGVDDYYIETGYGFHRRSVSR